MADRQSPKPPAAPAPPRKEAEEELAPGACVGEYAVTSLSDFLLDDVHGITSIWKLVGTLAPR